MVPVSPGGGAHDVGSPFWSNLEGGGEAGLETTDGATEVPMSLELAKVHAWASILPSSPEGGVLEATGAEEESLLAGRDILVVVLPSIGGEVTWVAARSSSGSEAAHDLVWPQPGGLGKARFVLRDGGSENSGTYSGAADNRCDWALLPSWRS